MIVKMKKVAFFTLKQDAAGALEALRRQGLVHVEHQQLPASQDLNSLQDDLALLDQALLILEQQEADHNHTAPKGAGDFRVASRHIIDLAKRIDYLQEIGCDLGRQINTWSQWGDFDPKVIEKLALKGVLVKFCQASVKELNKVPEGAALKVINVKAGVADFLLISQKPLERVFKEIELPKMGLSQMQQRLAEDKFLLQDLKTQLKQGLVLRQPLLEKKEELAKAIEFQQALHGMGESFGLSYLTGYAPLEAVPILQGLAKKQKWGILISDPKEDDDVPVLLKNPEWVNLISPVFKLMEVVPGYREIDISPLFLLFLALFFGMIIGDAGYGLVYFLLTFLAQRKLGAKVKDKTAFGLFYLFSSCAVFWGLLTGTVFGQQWYLAKGFKPLVPLLNEAKFLMSFCFFLGALQLSLAHAWQAVVKLPSLTALADIGFVCLLWAGFFLAKMFIVGDAFPFYGQWLIWAGISLIILFSNPQKNIPKGIFSGIGTLALGAMGNFGDVVSYIRLFAVGLAGVAVADSVNALAAGAGNNLIAQAAILFIGHTINITLGPISVLVHGVRLNVLEFSLLHGNVTWSGLAYKPLKN